MTDQEFDKITKILKPLVLDLFTIEAIYRHQDRTVISLGYKFDRERSNKLIKDRLKLSGYEYDLHESTETLTLTISNERKVKIPLINIALFILTICTVYFIPTYEIQMARSESREVGFENFLNALKNGDGILFTLGIISILLIHEMGHFIASRRRGIVTSWPYFIPAPTFIGTFGAIIKSKSPFWNRRDLIEVGAAGPIAGWIIAVVCLIYGLSQSHLLADTINSNHNGWVFQLSGESILMRWLVGIIHGGLSNDSVLVLSELARAGWIGLIITSINLIPISQFDGGHIFYGLFPNKQKVIGWIALGCLVILGYWFPGWWLMVGIGFMFGIHHPPTIEDDKKLSRAAIVMGVISIFILLVSLTPMPFPSPFQ